LLLGSVLRGPLLDSGSVTRRRWPGTREVELHTDLREAYAAWLTVHAGWPGADTTPALFLNRRGGRLGTRGRQGHRRTHLLRPPATVFQPLPHAGGIPATMDYQFGQET
jgi:hypothetical protein